MCTYYMSFLQMIQVFHHTLFSTNSQPLSFIQRNEHVEMNNFSCSLSCTWMLWILKVTISMRRSFEHPKTIMLNIMGKKIVTILS